MDALENIRLFQELVRCGGDIHTWCYGADGALLGSNCPDEGIFDTAFTLSGCRGRMLDYGAAQDGPVVLGAGMGLIWGAAFDKQGGQLARAYVLGPVFYSDTALRQIKEGLSAFQGVEVSIAWKSRFIQSLHNVSVSQHVVFSRYVLMLHCCLTGQRLNASDLGFLRDSASAAPRAQGEPHRDRYLVWHAERALLQMVRNGDLNYRSALHNSTLISNGVPLHSGSPLRQGKTSVTVFCSIVCRAAMEGGLSPEEAYSLGDAYIQSAENAKSIDELTAIAAAMYDDFVRRVHKCRTNPKLSPQIQRCCDYIEMHLEEKIRAAGLASLVGYTEYYLTHKFKEEVGVSVNDYVKFAKVERAKVLLKSTGLSVQDISDQLGFGTRNYFSRVFQEVAGCTPVQYREERSLH